MSVRAYMVAMGTLVMSVWFTPGLDQLFKMYALSMIAVIALVIQLLVNVSVLRNWIIEHIVVAVMQEILKDRDIQKLIHWEERRRRIREQLQEELRKRDAQSKQTPPR